MRLCGENTLDPAPKTSRRPRRKTIFNVTSTTRACELNGRARFFDPDELEKFVPLKRTRVFRHNTRGMSSIKRNDEVVETH